MTGPLMYEIVIMGVPELLGRSTERTRASAPKHFVARVRGSVEEGAAAAAGTDKIPVGICAAD